MLPSLLNSSRTRTPHRRDRSPFSSPFTITTSPIATRRALPYERRRPAADNDASDDPNNNGDTGEDAEGDIVEDEQEDGDEDEEENRADGGEDEDGAVETTPLLPIFSAAHLD